MYLDTKNYIQKHQSGLTALFSQGFDDIKSCRSVNCEFIANQQIPDAISRDNSHYNFSSTYFVRLSSNGQLQKLTISGHLNSIAPRTRGEKLVANFIKSNTLFLFPAYIDQGYDATYLNDYYSEAEIFVPVQVDGKTIGIIVRLYAS